MDRVKREHARKRGRGERSVKGEREKERRRRSGSGGEKGNERRKEREKKGSGGNLRDRDREKFGVVKRIHIRTGELETASLTASPENMNGVAEIMNHASTVQNTSCEMMPEQTAGPQDTIKAA
jgi:hypothetical protein